MKVLVHVYVDARTKRNAMVVPIQQSTPETEVFQTKFTNGATLIWRHTNIMLDSDSYTTGYVVLHGLDHFTIR